MVKVAIVTGANSGLGLALSVLLGKTHRVFAGMRSLSKKTDLMEAADKAGVAINVFPWEMDVNSDESVESSISKIIEMEKRVDILVNNAGYTVVGSVEQITMEDAQANFNTNLFGVMRCQKAVLPTMRAQRKGLIVNVSSIGGYWGQPFNDVYCATKFALEGMTTSQAALFRTFGVDVSLVCPGGIKTKFISNAKIPDMKQLDDEYKAPMASTMAAYQGGSIGSQTPEECAQEIIDQLFASKRPPLRIHPNAVTVPVAKATFVDPSGENTAAIASVKFMPSTE